MIQALTFLKEPADTTATEGGEVMLECSVDDKTASVKWFKEQAEIQQDYVAYTILADGSLRILKVRKDDSGSYFCRARTGTSSSITSRTITLTIQCKYYLFYSPFLRFIETKASYLSNI